MKKLFTLLLIAFVAINASAGIDPATRAKIDAAAMADLRAKVHQADLKHQVKLNRTFDLAPFTATAQPAKAKKASEAAASYEIEVTNIEATSASVSVTPSNDSPYYWMVASKEFIDEIEAGTYLEYEIADVEGYMLYNMNYYIKLYADYYGVELTYDDFLSTGADEYTYDSLDPETEYVVVASEWDADAEAFTGASSSVDFTTAAVVASENVITLSYKDGILSVKTTNNDPYILMFETTDDYEYYMGADYSVSAVAEELQSWYDTFADYGMGSYITFTGDQEIDLNDFWTTYMSDDDMASGEWIAMAAPYNGVMNGDAVSLIFNYEAAGVDPVDPDQPAEEVTINFTSVDTWSDAVASQGWWQVIAEQGEYVVSLSNNDNNTVEGVYETADMDASYTWIKVNGTKYNFSDITVNVTAGEQGGYLINAVGTAKNGVKYTMTFPEVGVPEGPVEPNGTVITLDLTDDCSWKNYVVDAGWWQVMGYTADETYGASLSNANTDEVAGDYATADMDLDYSFVYDFVEDAYIYFAEISATVAEDGNNYVVTGECLAKDGTTYKLTFAPVEDADLVATVIESLQNMAPKTTVKVIENGQVRIIKGNKKYNTVGAEMK